MNRAPVTSIRPGRALLDQFLLVCPGCGKAAAAHVDPSVGVRGALVRFVCPDSCTVDEDSVLTLLATLTAPAVPEEDAAVRTA